MRLTTELGHQATLEPFVFCLSPVLLLKFVVFCWSMGQSVQKHKTKKNYQNRRICIGGLLVEEQNMRREQIEDFWLKTENSEMDNWGDTKNISREQRFQQINTEQRREQREQRSCRENKRWESRESRWDQRAVSLLVKMSNKWLTTTRVHPSANNTCLLSGWIMPLRFLSF